MLVLLGKVNAQLPKWDWASKAYLSNGPEHVTEITTDHSGNVLAILFFEEQTQYASASSDTGFCLIKLDATGTPLWQLSLPIRPGSICTDEKDNIYILGALSGTTVVGTQTINNTGYDPDLYLLKYASSGTINWAKKLGDYAVPALPGTVACRDSVMYFIGGLGNNRVLSRLTTNGEVMWSKPLSSDTIGRGAKCLTIDTFGRPIIGGNNTTESKYGWGWFLCTFDKNGTVLSRREYWNPCCVSVYKIAVDASNNVFVFRGEGTHHQYALILQKFDSSLQPIWEKLAGDLHSPLYLNGGLVVAPDQNVVMSGAFGRNDYAHSDSIHIGGGYYKTMGGMDIAVAKFRNDDGSIVWFKTAGGSRNEGATNSSWLPGAITVDKTGNYFVAQAFNVSSPSGTPESCYFGNTELKNEGEWQQVAIAKLGSENPLAVNLLGENTNDFHIYPNPSSDIFTIQAIRNQAFSFMVFDYTGKQVCSGNTCIDSEVIDLSDHERGVYLVHILSEDGNRQTRKIIMK